jgi:hypothetical protein
MRGNIRNNWLLDQFESKKMPSRSVMVSISQRPAGHGFLDILLRDAQKVKYVSEAGSGQGSIGYAVDTPCGIVGDAESGLAEHEGVIGAVSHGRDLIQRDLEVTRLPVNDSGLFGRIKDFP